MVLRGKAAKCYKDHLLVEASLLSLYFHIEYKDSLNQSNSWIFLFLLFFFGRNYLDMGYKFKIEGHTKRTYLKDTMGSVY